MVNDKSNIWKLYSESLIEETSNEDAWIGTSWTDTIDGKEVTVTIKDILDLIKERPVQEIDTHILEPYALHKTKTDAGTLANIKKANLNYPIIVLKKHTTTYQILDGNHRLQKAINNKIPHIKARVIELKDMPSDWQKVFN
tara:strand:+ start:1130 stop:1552 length:423 start_codon:yes stop_codon:yes gene_type:complete